MKTIREGGDRSFPSGEGGGCVVQHSKEKGRINQRKKTPGTTDGSGARGVWSSDQRDGASPLGITVARVFGSSRVVPQAGGEVRKLPQGFWRKQR